mgnify:CR=1 FL=1
MSRTDKYSKKPRLFLPALILLLCYSGTAAVGQADNYYSSTVHILYSRHVEQEYAIRISKPANFNEESSYPVLVYTDADARIETLNGDNPSTHELLHSIAGEFREADLMPDVVLVGIAYPDGRYRLRNRDFTPSKEDFSEYQSVLRNGEELGGADNFLAFIVDELKPFLGEQFTVDENREIYLGHSFGGLFGAFALFRQPSAFDSYILSSPSLFWGNADYLFPEFETRTVFMMEDEYARTNSDLNKQIVIATGSFEGMVTQTYARTFAEKLESRNYPRLSLKYFEYSGESHRSVPLPTFRDGLLAIFAR